MKVTAVCVAAATLCTAALATVSVLGPSMPLPSHSIPLSSDSSLESSKIRQKRDYGIQADMPASPPETDSGVYYYYYPLEEEKGKKKELFKDHDKCTGEKLLAPLIIICIFLGIIAFKDIGLVPKFSVPPFTFPGVKKPDIDIPKARELVSSYVPWDTIDQVTLAVTEAVESEECLPRLVCESGKYATSYTTALSLLEFFMPRKLKAHMEIFKNSAYKMADCTNYKCSYAENK
ncbi:uncharacterized protein [Cherax quadricarinatus]|uniref:uncharacterized protein n=1 Tax=Cherax quadricarinatus TaxID=27406 RepID=UPI002378EB0B|nr:uncharacterized protein LOC128689719 [Cherax quadricarinatus]XP_053634088.1 uncharacterized protein LOC128689719 [Cherax quadricarinatus]